MSPDECVPPRRNGRGCENWDPLPFLSGATTQHVRFMPRPASIVADIMDGMVASKAAEGERRPTGEWNGDATPPRIYADGTNAGSGLSAF